MDADGYDVELRRHHDALRRAWGVRPGDAVLDVGCGTGQTTRDAARDGTALGVDLSLTAVERARERAAGLDNVTFEQADAQVHPFPRERFDLAVSRFGTMFFDDPVAAFTNIRSALRPGGRLAMMVWQSPERNEWATALRAALPQAPAAGPEFSLADAPTVLAILGAAGFADVAFLDVREPVYYGPDVAAALDWVTGFAFVREALTQVDPVAELLRAHLRADGVWFDSAAWIVTAHRR